MPTPPKPMTAEEREYWIALDLSQLPETVVARQNSEAMRAGAEAARAREAARREQSFGFFSIPTSFLIEYLGADATQILVAKMVEKRAAIEAEAAALTGNAARLRASGLTWREVGRRLDISAARARSIGKRANS